MRIFLYNISSCSFTRNEMRVFEFYVTYVEFVLQGDNQCVFSKERIRCFPCFEWNIEISYISISLP